MVSVLRDITYDVRYNMHMIKIIFFDIDGTLLKLGAKEMTPRIRETLQVLHKKGIKLVLATGRPSFVVPSFPDVIFDGTLSFNGQYCFNDREVIYKNPMNEDDVTRIIRNAADLAHHVQVATSKRMVANGYEADLEEYFTIANQRLYVADNFDEAIQTEVYQVMAAAKASEHEALLQGTKNAKIVCWWPKAVDIIPADGGKNIGMEKMLAYYGIDRSECMAFGDGGNDQDMLAYAGIGVAMGNALEEIKKIADHVTDSADEDGIYTACKHFGLL